MPEWMWDMIGLSKTTDETRSNITPQILSISWNVITGLIWLAVSLRFLWSGSYLIVPFMFENPDVAATIASFPLFDIWTGLEDQRWFGMTDFGMSILKLGIGIIALLKFAACYWRICQQVKTIETALDSDALRKKT